MYIIEVLAITVKIATEHEEAKNPWQPSADGRGSEMKVGVAVFHDNYSLE